MIILSPIRDYNQENQIYLRQKWFFGTPYPSYRWYEKWHGSFGTKLLQYLNYSWLFISCEMYCRLTLSYHFFNYQKYYFVLFLWLVQNSKIHLCIMFRLGIIIRIFFHKFDYLKSHKKISKPQKNLEDRQRHTNKVNLPQEYHTGNLLRSETSKNLIVLIDFFA